MIHVRVFLHTISESKIWTKIDRTARNLTSLIFRNKLEGKFVRWRPWLWNLCVVQTFCQPSQNGRGTRTGSSVCGWVCGKGASCVTCDTIFPHSSGWTCIWALWSFLKPTVVHHKAEQAVYSALSPVNTKAVFMPRFSQAAQKNKNNIKLIVWSGTWKMFGLDALPPPPLGKFHGRCRSDLEKV